MSAHRPSRLGEDLGGYKPPRDVALPVRDYVCPSCGAEVGEFCRNTSRMTHRSRRVMAVRARNA